MDNTLFLIGEGWGNESAKIGLLNHFSVTQLPDINALNDIKGAIIIFAGYKPIVPHNVIENNKCINIHYSLLPKYRGLHSTVWAILNDEDYLGLTVHLMNDYIDYGPIIHQYQIVNDRIKTSTDYIRIFNLYIEKNIGNIIKDFLSNTTDLKINDKRLATWVGKRNHNDCKIDFNWDIEYIRRFFRALVSPYPLPFIEQNGEQYVVSKVDFHPVNVNTHIGRLLNIDNDGMWIKAKDGYVIIKELRDKNNIVVPFHQFRIGQFFNSSK